ncbi:MAG TPA: TIR domain-containing protein [Pseudomonadales bacterium]|nr:TIR domain-containing protein [Pseudomonadales bacterium]
MNRPIPAGPFVFVSYAHDDLPLIRNDLTLLAERGSETWYDVDLTPGQPWAEQLATTIESATLFLIFLTPRSVRSPNCLNEVHFALQRGKRILTVYVEDVPLPPELELGLGRHQGIRRFSMSAADYMDRLPLIVGRLLAQRDAPTQRRASDRLPQATNAGLDLGADDLCRLAEARLAQPTPHGLAEARAFLDTALARAPDHAAAHATLALTLCAVRYPFTYSWNPRATRSVVYIWTGYDQQRVPAEARAHAHRALELDPGCAAAHMAMATLLLGEHNDSEARPHVEAARTLAPVDAHAAVLETVSRARAGDPQGAVALMDATIADHPGSALLHFHAARLADRLGEWAPALRHGQQALALAPDWSGALLLQAEHAAKAGDWVGAWQWLQRAADSEPAHFAHQTALVVMLVLLGGTELGARKLEEIDTQRAPAGMLEMLRLNLLAADDRLEEVVERSEAWLRREPLTPIPMMFAAHGHLMRGRAGTAITYLEDHLAPFRDEHGSVQIQVTNALAAILYQVAKVWDTQGADSEVALRRILAGLEQMRAAGNVTPETHYGRACILALLGEHGSAVEALAAALGQGQMRLWELEQFVGFAPLRETEAYRTLKADFDERRAQAVRAIAALDR